MISTLNVYFIHSDNINYNDELYLPVLRSNILSKHNLIFSQSEENKKTYFKDLISKSDLVVILIDEPSVTFNLEIKEALIEKKPTLALAKAGKPYDPKYQSLLNNVIGYNNEEELRHFIETFVQSYENKINGGVMNTTVILGVLD